MKEIDLLSRILKDESPLLFLGAGFSLGAKLNNGCPFLSGGTLKLYIIQHYLKLNTNDTEYSELEQYTLSDLCQYIKNEEGAERLNDFLGDLFKNSKPAHYHYSIASFPWRKIYTTNIDDIIESVYKSLEKNYWCKIYKENQP